MRAQRWLAVGLALLLASAAGALDLDGDGVEDAADNCPAVANGPAQDAQADADADGIGDACECGDASGDGRVNTTDARLIQRCAVGQIPCGALCDVTGEGECNTTDARLIGRLAVGQLGKEELRCTERPGLAGAAQTDFVSADATAGESSGGVRTYDLFADAAPEETTVEEGDIYRVLGGGLILNLNAYRGLQVIDIRDVGSPEIVGRLRVSGSPVELYVVGERAFVLLNHWHGYYGWPGSELFERHEGGVVLAVDLHDPTGPAVIDRARVPGTIRTSRLTRAGDAAALYVAAGGWAEWENEDGSRSWESRTVVQSFDVSSGRLAPRTRLDLGGYVTDVQATPEALLVARNVGSAGDSGSRVSLIDISDPSGGMVEGDEVLVDGWVRSQFNMDLHQEVLRVVSSAGWPPRNTLQTFDASNLQALQPIDRVTFGDGESLFATLFLANKAFFVTYRRVDPFHAFFISDAGFATEMAEFVVSGWNDFFRPVFGESRLIGIGVDDQDGRSAAVSLYDITDLANPEPLLARADVGFAWTWSEASWDHRAFSVLEGAVSVAGPDGVTETGLVLLPFSGWDGSRSTYTAAVQLFTFSERSLTRRGLMVHGTPVRRSFLAEGTTANLSELELSLFDTSDPDRPEELGRVELAPDYTRVFRFGDSIARVKSSLGYYGGWWGSRSELPPAAVEIVPAADDPDAAPPVARFEIPAGAATYQVGSLLVSVDMQLVDSSQWPYRYHTEIAVWDLRDPKTPVQAGGLSTDRLRPSYGYYYPMYDPIGACFDCAIGWPIYAGAGDSGVRPVENGLVFLQRHDERELLGTERVCSIRPTRSWVCWSEDGWVPGCTDYSGSLTCRSLNGGEQVCSGQISRCTVDEAGERSCVAVDPDSVPTTEACWDHDRYRYWQRFSLEVLDLTAPDAPALADTVELPREDEGVDILAQGSDVWVSFKRPEPLEDEARPLVRHFIRRVDVAVPSSPQLDDPINVPGRLLAIEGSTIFTRDVVWGEKGVETAVARLELADGLAYLRARRVFREQIVDAILLDGAGHLLASHRPVDTSRICLARDGIGPYPCSLGSQSLSVLDAMDLDALSEVQIGSFAQLRDARAGRALFQVPGGLLVFNLDDPTQPYPQAFFATQGFPSQILVDGRRILFAAGRFGIYTFDLDAFNLLPLDAAGPD